MKNEKKIKVLVADNSEFARNNLKKFLENNEKIQLLNIADNGKDAYRVIIDEVPDIVLIDVILPVMDLSLIHILYRLISVLPLMRLSTVQIWQKFMCFSLDRSLLVELKQLRKNLAKGVF